MSTKRFYLTGFTLIELLVVISIIALLIGILLPGLGAARRVALQMKNATQVRSVHQSMVIFANGNRTFLPGLDLTGVPVPSDYTLFNGITGGNTGGPAGGAINTRMYLLLNGSYLAGDLLLSPIERVRSKWTDSTQLPTPDQMSYSVLRLIDPTQATPPNSIITTGNTGRLGEWRDNGNSLAIIACDRNSAVGNDSASPHSVWSQSSLPLGDWTGDIVWGDNHVQFLTTWNSQTTQFQGLVTTNDNLFSDTESQQPGYGSMFGAITDNY